MKRMPLSTAEIKLTDFWMGFGMLWVQSVYMTTAECVLMSSRPQRGDTPVVMRPGFMWRAEASQFVYEHENISPSTPLKHTPSC